MACSVLHVLTKSKASTVALAGATGSCAAATCRSKQPTRRPIHPDVAVLSMLPGPGRKEWQAGRATVRARRQAARRRRTAPRFAPRLGADHSGYEERGGADGAPSGPSLTLHPPAATSPPASTTFRLSSVGRAGGC